jgi:flagellar protein FlaG
MSRIEATVATQIADANRPLQSSSDRSSQQQATQVAKVHQAPEAPIAADDVRAAAARLKQVVEAASSRKLSFSIDHDSGELFVQVKDMATGEVIRQIPSKEVMSMHQRLDEMMGILLDREA